MLLNVPKPNTPSNTTKPTYSETNQTTNFDRTLAPIILIAACKPLEQIPSKL